jgi:hypothetical protein
MQVYKLTNPHDHQESRQEPSKLDNAIVPAVHKVVAALGFSA